MSVIEAAFVTSKMLVDGTLRVSFDVEPRNAKAAFDLFHVPGVPAALAALVVGGGAPEPAAEPAPSKPRRQPSGPRERMAPLCEWAVMRCADPQFQEWIRPVYDKHMGGSGRGYGDVTPSDDFGGNVANYTAHCLKVLCQVDSRKELDTSHEAAELFHEKVRKPYTAWLEKQGVTA